MILPLIYNPGLWGFIAQSHSKALATSVGFEMLDRVPAKQPDPEAVAEDPMAVQKTAA